MKNKTRNGKAPLTPGRILYRLLSGFLILIFLIAVAAGIGQIRDRLSPDGYDYYEPESVKLYTHKQFRILGFISRIYVFAVYKLLTLW